LFFLYSREHLFLLLQQFKQIKSLKGSHDIRFNKIWKKEKEKKNLADSIEDIKPTLQIAKEMVVSQACTRRIV